MRKHRFIRALLALAVGAIAFQTSTCTSNQIGLITLASVVTAGGVVYLVYKIES